MQDIPQNRSWHRVVAAAKVPNNFLVFFSENTYRIFSCEGLNDNIILHFNFQTIEVVFVVFKIIMIIEIYLIEIILKSYFVFKKHDRHRRPTLVHQELQYGYPVNTRLTQCSCIVGPSSAMLDQRYTTALDNVSYTFRTEGF